MWPANAGLAKCKVLALERTLLMQLTFIRL